MYLLVLGASGGVGRHVITGALARGHKVTTLVRPTTTLSQPEGLRVVRGGLFDGSALDEAMTGADAVLSSIGLQRENPRNPWSRLITDPDISSRAARRIVEAMTRCGVRRVVAVSAGGVGDSAPRLNLVMRFFLATSTIGIAYRDLALMEEVYASSGLDWLAPRPTRLHDGPATSRVKVVDAFGVSDAIARADVAAWMLDTLQVTTWPANEWQGRTPQISAAS